MNLPAEIYSVETVRRIDRLAIDDAGIGGYSLMTRAAEAALSAAHARFPEARRWQVVCGSGNNGGDGYVLARLAAREGIAVSVVALAPADRLRGDAATACVDLGAEGGAVDDWQGELDPEAELLVDALLGSGLERELEGAYAAAVAAMNRHPAPVLALDIPSGLHGDSGAVMGCAVVADLTVTFVGLKTGLFLGEAKRHVGELVFAGLEIPAECRASSEIALRRIDDSVLRAALPRRARSAHKGDFGHLLLIGGGPGMPGAIRLAGEAALRSGAGRVSIAAHPSSVAVAAAGRAELMCHAAGAPDDIEALLARADVVGIGPGLGTDDWALALLTAAVGRGLPMVVDADALNLLAASNVRADDWILTPHPGEAARLLGIGTAEVQGDRRAAVRELAARYRGTVVLKGAGTLVSAADGPCWLSSAGNPGMATAGMGDVLTGVVGGLRAQRLEREMAAVCGVEVHGRAGDAAAGNGERGLIASDLLEALRRIVNP